MCHNTSCLQVNLQIHTIPAALGCGNIRQGCRPTVTQTIISSTHSDTTHPLRFASGGRAFVLLNNLSRSTLHAHMLLPAARCPLSATGLPVVNSRIPLLCSNFFDPSR